MENPMTNQPENIDFVGIRVRQFTTRSFDQVLAELRTRVGETTTKNIEQLSVDAETREEFASRVEKHIGSSGFMLFAEINHGRWIEKYGIKRRLLRWVIGNPLIAITMLQQDYTTGLFVPIALLLAEDEDGAGCNITYVVPSSLMMVRRNSQLASAAKELDLKIKDLVALATATKG